MKTNFYHLKTMVGAVSLAFTLASAGAVTLTNVPMQGGMLMPAVSYNAASSVLSVNLPAETPQLTPLLASNLGDCFDPADPWYNCLDPSRQGLAFSRRYGFNMATGSDPLPAGTAIWIRKLSGSPGLEFYRYRSMAPKAWEPIFGTAGTTNALQWNQVMFHPGVTAPPGTNTYTATFELFLLDTATGTPIAGSSSGLLVFNWSTVPDGRPALAVAPMIAIAWPSATSSNWVLEAADSLSGSPWTLVTNTAVLLDGQPAVLLEPQEALRVFRMRLVP
ncbi:MAG TPA: hypothetical protein VJA21_07505 [Verrucomicrobiae bacterium]